MEQEILQEQKKPNALAFQTALLFSFYIIILTYVFELTGMGADKIDTTTAQKLLSSVLSYLPFIFAIYFVQAKHKKDLGGFITFGRAFSAGFKVAAYSGLFIAILILLYYKVLSPDGIDRIIEASLAKAGNDANAQKGVEMMQKYMLVFMMFGIAVSYTLIGLIISLITGAIIKKDRPVFFGQQNNQVDEEFPAQS